MSIADIRRVYARSALQESTLDADPHVQFDRWLQQALTTEIRDPTAMTLATADNTGRPSARIVLLKGFDSTGFVFYTHYGSRKGAELAANPQASLLFYWAELERQVRIEGRVTRVEATESDAYFNSRPLASRISAWASPQSQPISHEALARHVNQLARTLGDQPARPDFWGGFRLQAARFEFWQGRPSRLHDRLVYTARPDGTWALERIAP